ncbi:MAG: hypothetical protein Roseis2KO_48840 [Roseivirga sp.]
MTTLLIKASMIIMVLLAFYKLVLERESFFRANRVYLMSCLVLACALPFVVLPQIAENQGIVSELIEPAAKDVTAFIPSEEAADTRRQLPPSNPTTMQNQPDKRLVPDKEGFNASENKVNAETAKSQSGEAVGTITKADTPASKKSLSFWLIAVYIFGAAILLIRLLGQVTGTLWKVHRHEDKIEDEGAIIVNMTGAVAPCSFFKYIFINPASYDYDTYEQILAHEKIHVSKGHSVDLLFSELAVALLWFNPFVWMLRKEVEKNIEYQTDGILVNASAEVKESYQLNLVRIACDTQPLAITTNYNQSLIKQRILKMNNKQSNNYSHWKYAFVAPVIFSLVVVLNKPNVSYAQERLTEGAKTLPDGAKGIDEPEALKPGENAMPLSAFKDGCSDLTEAVRNDDLALVKELLKSQKPNCVDPEPGYTEIISGRHLWRKSNARTPLAAAARNGNLEIAKLLVEAGARVGFDAGDHGSPMTEASGGGHTEFVSYLLENGADINERSEGQGSPLNAAARYGHTETVAFLLTKGADVNYQNDGQGSALNAAARNGHLETMKLLVQKGADIHATNDGQGSSLNAAARNGHLEAATYLLDQGVDVNDQNDGQGSALNAAARNGHDDMVKLLLDRGADVDRQNDGQGTALNAAARNGHDSTVKLLLERGANMDRRNDGQGSALNAAARNGHLATMKLLLEAGADIDAANDGQGSALNAAARNGHIETATFLLDHGADVNDQNDGQGSALNAAARNGHEDMVKLLLDRGADIDRQNDGQGSALNAAARNGQNKVIELLLDRGADINRHNDGQGSALNAAARNGHLSTIELLLERGADIDSQNDGQGSALNAAARNGHLKTVEFLLDKGADINRQNDGQGSALNAAARNGHLRVVQLLVDKGARVNQYSSGQGTALSAASRNRHRKVVQYLISQGADR